MTNPSDIRRKLKDSLEMAHIRSCLILYAVAIAAGGALWVFTSGSLDESIINAAVMSAALFLPVLIFCLWRIFSIYREPGSYIFFRAKLSQPHQSHLRYAMYFTVVLEYPDGSKIVENTHAIFQTHGFLGPLLEDYVNRTVTIAYNEETEQVVVIG